MSSFPPLEPPGPSQAEPVPAAAVRDQLARVVGSTGFAASRRLCRFLSYIVDRTLEGEASQLKEFSIAIEVFDRSNDYDPNVDAIVRVEARRLRAKLKAYYENTNDPVLISLHGGSYVPVFRWAEPPELRPGRMSRHASVAVLPFVNMSPEPEQEYFCDGLSEEIINSLTRLPELNVIARTSAFQFKGVPIDIREAGRRLGADVIIEGSVRKTGAHLRITAEAVDASNGYRLWSQGFHREMKDVFAIQEEIARAVAGLLRVHAPESPTAGPNVQAYTAYLRARVLVHQQTPESLRSALQQLRELVAAYPDYALGYSGLAAATGLLTVYGAVSGRDIYPELKTYAERGYALNPESAETCTVLGGLRSWFEHRWKDAESLYGYALKVQPAHVYAHVFRGVSSLCQGDIAAAEASLGRAMELNPLSSSDWARWGYFHYVKGAYPNAAEYFKRARELDPHHAECRFFEGLLHLQQEQYEVLLDRLSPSLAPLDVGLTAAAHARIGNRAAAGACVEKLRILAEQGFVTPLAFAFAAIGMRDFDAAFVALGEAVEHRTSFINFLAVEPVLKPLRSDARFSSLLKTLNLPHSFSP